MSDILVIGGGFGGNYFAKKVGAPVLTRSNGYDLNHIGTVSIGIYGNRGPEHLIQRIRDERPKVIVNFASQSMVAQSWERPADWLETNCVGQTNLLCYLTSCDFIEKYIHFTTPEVYGNTPDWTKENWDFKPSTPYAASRACGDWMVKMWHDQYGFPAIFTRAANIYGEGQQLYRIIPKALCAKFNGKSIPLHGGGTSKRSFVHMDDVTDALMLLVEKGDTGLTYHISPHEAVTIRELVEMIGCGTELAPDRPGKDEAYLLDSQRIMDLGWSPKVSLPEGITRVDEWMRSNWDTWKTWPTEYRHAA